MLSNEYTELASNLLKWIKVKLEFLNREIKFRTLDEIKTYQDVLQVIKNDEMNKYQQILYRMRSIDAEYEVNNDKNNKKKKLLFCLFSYILMIRL